LVYAVAIVFLRGTVTAATPFIWSRYSRRALCARRNQSRGISAKETRNFWLKPLSSGFRLVSNKEINVSKQTFVAFGIASAIAFATLSISIPASAQMGRGGGYGPGMMDGQGYGPGMMGNYGPGMMGGWPAHGAQGN
jgi:hypothetical protein